eukprot:7384752-Pyramimonas_sp.AAC.1
MSDRVAFVRRSYCPLAEAFVHFCGFANSRCNSGCDRGAAELTAGPPQGHPLHLAGTSDGPRRTSALSP